MKGRRITVYVSDLEYDRISKLAAEKGVSMSKLFVVLLKYYKYHSQYPGYVYDFKTGAWQKVQE